MLKKQIISNDVPKAVGPYSQCLLVGDRLYTSGILGMDPITMDFVSDDIMPQARKVLENLKSIVTAGGSNLNQVIKVEIFLVDMSYFPAINQIFLEYFDMEVPPVRVTVAVRSLPHFAKIMMACEAYVEPKVTAKLLDSNDHNYI